MNAEQTQAILDDPDHVEVMPGPIIGIMPWMRENTKETIFVALYAYAIMCIL